MSEENIPAVSEELRSLNSRNESNNHNEYIVTQDELPLHCPRPGMSKWNSHPKVFIPVQDTGKEICPYCGTSYRLK